MSASEVSKDSFKVQEIQREDAPMIYASSFRIMGTGNDFMLLLMLLLQKPTPVRTVANEQLEAAVLDTVAVATMSPQSLKDLKLLIEKQIEAYEQEFGRLVTPYTRQVATSPA